jgi:formamidopyrimidine-DNA glycosylase
MPELPEVETVVRGLRAAVLGRCIAGVRLGKTDFIENPAQLAARLPGKRIAAIERYGKFISLQLKNEGHAEAEACLAIHLGMTGQIVVRRPEDAVAPHTHVFVSLDDGREIRYTDMRRFGRIRLLSGPLAAGMRKRLGQDPLEVSAEEFRTLLGGRRTMIKALLLDQHALRGMGNIYVDESLWRARVHPRRRAVTLAAKQVDQLFRAIQHVLRAAIEHRGSSISDYLDAEGQPGTYQQRHRVYQREGRPCARCRMKIRRVIVAGRSSYFCPRCQRAPRLREERSTKK